MFMDERYAAGAWMRRSGECLWFVCIAEVLIHAKMVVFAATPAIPQ